jgi:hypothetical protein
MQQDLSWQLAESSWQQGSWQLARVVGSWQLAVSSYVYLYQLFMLCQN